MIEELLKELIAAVKANTNALIATLAEAPAAPAPAPVAEPKKSKTKVETPAALATPPPAAEEAPKAETKAITPAINLDTLRAIAQEILDAGGLEEIRKVNAEQGIKRVSECPPEKFESLQKALTALKDKLTKAV